MQWTRPKSVRQIGEIPGRGRIYMEDYVIRFVKRLAEQSHGMEKAAVLLGTSLICDGEKIYQISGVVEIHNFAGRSGPKFTDEDWDYIYSEMKENFTDLEIVGWFYSCQGFSVNQAGQLLQMHKLNYIFMMKQTVKIVSFCIVADSWKNKRVTIFIMRKIRRCFIIWRGKIIVMFILWSRKMTAW